MMDYEVLKSQLNGEFREVFAKAQMYGIMANMPQDYLDGKLADLYDLLLTAQTDGRPPRQIIGADAERFCKNFFGDHTPADHLRELPRRVYVMAWFVFVVSLVEQFTAEPAGQGFFAVKADVLPYLSGLLVGAVLVIAMKLLAPRVLKAQKVKEGRWFGGYVVAFIAAMAVCVAVGNRLTVEWLLPAGGLMLGAGMYLVVYLIARCIWRYKNYGTVRNVRKAMEQDSYYRGLENRDVERILLEGWQKQFARLSQKGKLTAAEFLPRLKKSERSNEIAEYVVTGFYVLLWGYSVFHVSRESALPDTLFFAALVGAVTFGMYRFFHRIYLKNSALRKKHYRLCEQSGNDMPAYIEDALKNF